MGLLASTSPSHQSSFLSPLISVLRGLAASVLMAVLMMGALCARFFDAMPSKRDLPQEAKDVRNGKARKGTGSEDGKADVSVCNIGTDDAATPMQICTPRNVPYISEDVFATAMRPTPPGQTLFNGRGPTPSTPLAVHPASRTVPAPSTSAPPSPSNGARNTIVPRNLDALLLAVADGTHDIGDEDEDGEEQAMACIPADVDYCDPGVVADRAPSLSPSAETTTNELHQEQQEEYQQEHMRSALPVSTPPGPAPPPSADLNGIQKCLLEDGGFGLLASPSDLGVPTIPRKPPGAAAVSATAAAVKAVGTPLQLSLLVPSVSRSAVGDGGGGVHANSDQPVDVDMDTPTPAPPPAPLKQPATVRHFSASDVPEANSSSDRNGNEIRCILADMEAHGSDGVCDGGGAAAVPAWLELSASRTLPDDADGNPVVARGNPAGVPRDNDGCATEGDKQLQSAPLPSQPRSELEKEQQPQQQPQLVEEEGNQGMTGYEQEHSSVGPLLEYDTAVDGNCIAAEEGPMAASSTLPKGDRTRCTLSPKKLQQPKQQQQQYQKQQHYRPKQLFQAPRNSPTSGAAAAAAGKNTITAASEPAAATPRILGSTISPKQLKRTVMSPTGTTMTSAAATTAITATPATARRPVGPNVRGPRPSAGNGDKRPVVRKLINPTSSKNEAEPVSTSDAGPEAATSATASPGRADVGTLSETALASSSSPPGAQAQPALQSFHSCTSSSGAAVATAANAVSCGMGVPRYAAPTAASKARLMSLQGSPGGGTTTTAATAVVSPTGGAGGGGGGGATGGGGGFRRSTVLKLRFSVSSSALDV